ncbi:MAG: dodecin domain-containing protein [bacterium]|nr:MAG: dodecin domain-containing protein [bacterium]
MIKLMEVVGLSKVGYSEAIKDIVNQIIASGNKVYWFEVIEQRGAVKGDNIEYQVVLRVSVES